MKSCGLIRNILSTHIRSDCSFEWICVLMLVSFGWIISSIKWLITNHPRYCWLRFPTECDSSRYFFICGTCKILWKIFMTAFRWTTWKYWEIYIFDVTFIIFSLNKINLKLNSTIWWKMNRLAITFNFKF